MKTFPKTCQPAMPKRSQWAARGSAGQTEGAHPLTIYTVGLAEFEKWRSIEKKY